MHNACHVSSYFTFLHDYNRSDSEQNLDVILDTVPTKLWTRMSVNPALLQSQNVWAEPFGQHAKLPTDMGIFNLNQPIVTPLRHYFALWTIREAYDGFYDQYVSGELLSQTASFPFWICDISIYCTMMHVGVKVSKRSSTENACPDSQNVFFQSCFHSVSRFHGGDSNAVSNS